MHSLLINLKHGWIMLACILAMCTVGSYVAFIVGNVVLGSFTLFLTFFIGIRFLTKVPSYIFRKLLHIVAFSCFMVMLLTTES